MTKEELKEQDVRLNKLCSDYLKREKRIADLEKVITELEAQIEKMKCCGNCARFCKCRNRGDVECKNFGKWELRR